MVITFSATRAANGPRPINPHTDFPQLLGLLRLVFASEMELESRRVFDQAAAGTQPAVLWRLDPFLSRLSPGLVWEVDGRLVGNVTLLTTKSPQRFLVANVAVHPDYRRRGIARGLMEAVHEEVRRRGGKEILLQVERDNSPARDLYDSMGYANLGSMTTWRLSSARARSFEREGPWDERSDDLVTVRELPARRWREAYELDRSALDERLHWPEPLANDAYQRGVLRRLTDFTSGRRSETWASVDERNRLIGLAAIRSEWGRAHQMCLRVAPDWQGRLERPLLRKMLARVRSLPQRRVLLVHNADDMAVNALVQEAHFVRQRTLTHMALVLR